MTFFPDPKKLDEKYNALVTEIVSKTYSSDLRELNNFVFSEQTFKEMMSGYLGFEVANFYFYDQGKERLEFFHKAIPDGIQMPFCVISGFDEDQKTFTFDEIPLKEFMTRRDKQIKSFDKNEDPTTATLGYGNLTEEWNNSHRWSQSEGKNNWLLIPEGEIITFAFEYNLREELARRGITTKKEALDELKSTSITEHCWHSMHDPTVYPYMAGRSEKSKGELKKWLKHILGDKNEFDYLWNSDAKKKNWFIERSDDVVNLITPYNGILNFDVICALAQLMIEHSYPFSKDARIDVGSSCFYERSRISPTFELLHGSHNVVMFLIRVYFSSEVIDEPLKVFLLGTFYNRKWCIANRDKIKNIYSILATRDLQRYSMEILERSLKKSRKHQEILSTFAEGGFVHELSRIGGITLHTELIENAAKKNGVFEKIEEPLTEINTIVRKTVKVLKLSRDLAALGSELDKKLVNLSTALPKMVKESIENIPEIPDGVDITTEVLYDRILCNIDEYSVQLALENLIKNAIEATEPKGKVVIKTWRENNLVKLSVADNGPGISREILPHMFELRKTTKTKKQQKLAGIGLYLCRNLIEAQDGTLEGKNMKTRGAVFTITLNASSIKEKRK